MKLAVSNLALPAYYHLGMLPFVNSLGVEGLEVVVLCFAPLPPAGGNFCTLARHCYMLTNAIDHDSFGLHLGAAVLAANGEMGHTTFAAVRGRLDLIHLDEPDHAVLGSSGRVDHNDMRNHLAAITYKGWASLVQRTSADATTGLKQGLRFFAESYLSAGANRGIRV